MTSGRAPTAALVPALALGTVQFGIAYGIAGRAEPVQEAAVRDILSLASAVGVTRLDTAAAYGDIEERLARLVGDLPFSIVSKIPALPEGLTSAQRLDFVEASIRRSHDRLGGLLCGLLFHDGALFSSPGEDALWDRAASLCAQLNIQLGVSGYDPAATAKLAARLPLAMTQLPANAFDQRIIAAASGLKGCETTLRSIFLQGLLLMPQDEAAKRLPASAAAIAAWHRWCAAQGLAPLQGAIAAARSLPASFCVVGVDDAAQFEEIAGAWAGSSPRSVPELATDDPAIIDPRAWHRQ
jgi:aryl-alcohol dehydrogenase-like predicted oxidoreductase